MQSSRRLVAIMFTDIAGYTALAQSEEQRAIRLLSTHRELLRSIFARFSGREVKTIGDAFLVEFPSALEAVRCAYSIQSEMYERNLELDERDRVQARIGVHVGDVIYGENGDILGDSVNVASRIEPLASPGGICMSGQVYDQVRNKVDYKVEKMESKKLKNVILPVSLYRIAMPWEEQAQDERGEKIHLEPRRVAVLPFKNLSPDPNDEFFADGMTEELITSISNVRQLTVIARTSIMQYKSVSKNVTEIGRELNAGTLIEGSIRKAANRIRVTVQMIDAQNDGHLWARNYDRQLEDVFAIQSDIAESVAGELKVHLVDYVRQRLENKPTENPEVYTLYLKGKHYWNERSSTSIRRALEYFELSVSKDRNFALGYAWLANCYQVIAHNHLGEFGSNFQKCKEYAMKALELDPNLAEAHAVFAGYLDSYEHDWKRAEEEFKRAIELNPSYSTAHQWYAQHLAKVGYLEDGLKEIYKALELDPFSLIINTNVGDGLYYVGDFEGSVRQLKKVVEMDPLFIHSYPSLILTYTKMGKFAEAMQALDKYESVCHEPLEVKLTKARILASMGNKQTEALELLKDVEANWKARNISPYQIAIVHFVAIDVAEGFRWLDVAYDVHDASLIEVAIDYEFEGLRNDPRYIELVRKLGLSRGSA